MHDSGTQGTPEDSVGLAPVANSGSSLLWLLFGADPPSKPLSLPSGSSGPLLPLHVEPSVFHLRYSGSRALVIGGSSRSSVGHGGPQGRSAQPPLATDRNLSYQ